MTHTCEIYEIKIEKHPDPEVTAIEVGKIGDYCVVVGKGIFKDGDRVVYIPSQSLVPDALIEELNLVGKLAGPLKNRVKPIKLRGVMSEGLVLKDRFPTMPLGTDVASILGVTKYIPRIPAQFQGEAKALPEFAYKFDIENIKKYPDVFQEGELVYFTEKLHGTFVGIQIPPLEAWTYKDEEVAFDLEGKGLPLFAMISSKGLMGQGIFLKNTEKNKTSNIYLRTLLANDCLNKILKFGESMGGNVTVMGEIFGNGVQSGFNYGLEGSQFRVFAIYLAGKPLNQSQIAEMCADYGLEKVPTLYFGPFSKEILLQYTTGKNTLSGTHIREGVVVTPVLERKDPLIGRTILKSINEKYLEKETGEEIN